MSSAISSTVSEKPSLAPLHAPPHKTLNYATGALQDLLTAGQQHTSLRQWEIKDFGVGLPPLVEC
jgi:hypothetical protein